MVGLIWNCKPETKSNKTMTQKEKHSTFNLGIYFELQCKRDIWDTILFSF